MLIQYLSGDATVPEGDGPWVIIHCCNDIGLFGSGFALCVRERYPRVAVEYRSWFKKESPLDDTTWNTGAFGLGQVQFVQVAAELYVSNIIGQHGVRSVEEAPTQT